MSPVSHQTVTLAKGKHSSPEEGACVMELASMLAGEPFSDHPASACPVLGSFLRAYNDSIGDERRQDLYAYAARVVGTRSGAPLQRRRAELLAAWAQEMQRRRWTRIVPGRMLVRLGLQRQPPAHGIGMYAVRSISRHTDETHRKALELVEELLEIGSPHEAPAPEATHQPPPALYPIA
jgi:hypothetical protein